MNTKANKRMDNMHTLVMTSVNPFNKLDYQKLCFNSWKELGYNIKTFNSSTEKAMLLNAGFEENDIVQIEVNETAKGLFNKEIPRLLPVLNRAVNLHYDAYLLTNADIFPAHRKIISPLLATLSDCIALTRNECVYLGNNKYTDNAPYRGGLDTFFFTYSGLHKIFNTLIKEEVSERMTFGIPGWDYYLGHVILQNDGLIMDGEVLLHQSHQTTYGKIDEFQFYADIMLKSGEYLQNEVNAIASEFAQKIDSECEVNQKKSTLLKRMYYASPSMKTDELYTNEISGVCLELDKTLNSNQLKYKVTKELRGFIKSQLEGVSWVAAEAFRKNEMRGMPIIESSFILLSIQLIIKKITNQFNVTSIYPEGNMHSVALKQIIQNTQGMERLHYLIGLFSSELAEHNIFNKQIFKYFILASDSNRKLASCKTISSICIQG